MLRLLSSKDVVAQHSTWDFMSIVARLKLDMYQIRLLRQDPNQAICFGRDRGEVGLDLLTKPLQHSAKRVAFEDAEALMAAKTCF